MIKEFTTQRVYFTNDGCAPYTLGKVNKWKYNEDDMMYYHEDTDVLSFMDVPNNGKKTCSLKLNKHCRLLVRIVK